MEKFPELSQFKTVGVWILTNGYWTINSSKWKTELLPCRDLYFNKMFGSSGALWTALFYERSHVFLPSPSKWTRKSCKLKVKHTERTGSWEIMELLQCVRFWCPDRPLNCKLQTLILLTTQHLHQYYHHTGENTGPYLWRNSNAHILNIHKSIRAL